MNTQIQNRITQNKFTFEGVAVSRELEMDANAQLDGLLALAPPGACGAGVLYQAGHRYRATVVVQSPYRHFVERAVGTNPRIVVNKVLNKLENDLFIWRHGTGAPQAMLTATRSAPTGQRKEEPYLRIKEGAYGYLRAI